MRISKHFSQRAVLPRLARTCAKPVCPPRASATRGLSSGEAIHVITEAFAIRLQNLSILHPAVAHLDFPGIEIVSMPPGNIIFSLNQGEAFLEKPLLVFDNLSCSPRVGEALQDLALTANFKILE